MADRPGILFVFLDGVGLGPPDAAANPLTARRPALEALAGGRPWTADVPAFASDDHVFSPLDARLDVAGLPQSGTGQATLLTGVNCAEIAGRHFGPFPHSTSKPVLEHESVFAKLGRMDRTTAFANAYPERFFRYVESSGRWTTTTLACLQAGVRLRGFDDLRSGDAIPADLTGAGWPESRLPPVIDEAESGRRLAALAARHDFTLFEFFLTDKAGHSRDPDRAATVLDALDRFFAGLTDALDPARRLLLVTSDHGNLEDLATKSHTMNPVPLVAVGRGAGAFAGARSLLDVTPAIVEALR